LIDCYGYDADNIVVLIDRDEEGQMQPTRANMLQAIRKLVEGAQSGDHFFFHYAGHTVQVENKNNSEEDGMDECIIPSDGEAHIITDNELRRELVNELPVGSNLVAVFDSCHSGSLLDLEHVRCNQVYVPWISKGKRRTDSKLNGNVRRLAFGELVMHEFSPPPAAIAPEISSRLVCQNKRISTSNVRSQKTSIEKFLYSSTPNIRTKSLTIKSDLEKWYDWPSSPPPQCSSPDPLWPCTGYCTATSPKEANVISLAACKDDQLSWEDGEGSSMTKALIKVLKDDPHPNLRDLMTRIAHELHTFHLGLHRHARAYRKKLKEVNLKRAAKHLPLIIPPDKPEMDNFQDPQLSSHQPLAKNARWDP